MQYHFSIDVFQINTGNKSILICLKILHSIHYTTAPYFRKRFASLNIQAPTQPWKPETMEKK